MVNRFRLTLCLFLTLLLLIPVNAWAQEEDETLKLSVRRDFGYGDGTHIQGRFSLRVSGPEDLLRVEFLIDDEIVSIDTEPPFRYGFSTGEFSPGKHTLAAIGYTTSGESLRSSTRTYEFITAEEARASIVKFVVTMIVLVGVFILLGALGLLMLGRRKGAFRPGEYGLAGGAVCPRCSLPYSRHVLAPNMLVGKLERCPHCGKWALVRRATTTELEAAEAGLVVDRDQGRLRPEEDDEERLRRMLDESRFE